MDKFRIMGGLVLIAGFSIKYVIHYYNIALDVGFFYGAMLAIGVSFLIFGEKLTGKKQ